MTPPQLKQFASLWTLHHYPHGSEEGEWSHDQKLAAIKSAGFEGFQGSALPDFADLSEKHGLSFLGTCDANAATYVQRLQAFAPLRPVRINVQLCDHDTEPRTAVGVWIDLLKVAEDMGLTVDLEVHRDTCTETPEKTWQIADLFAEATGRLIRYNFDHSHFAVVKHLAPPYAGRLLERPELLQASRQIHLRPFNGHHCEIPVTNGEGKMAELARPWFDFVEEAFLCWLEGDQAGEQLWACPEFGAMGSGYWLPSFPDPWKDAVFTRQELVAIWRRQTAAP